MLAVVHVGVLYTNIHVYIARKKNTRKTSVTCTRIRMMYILPTNTRQPTTSESNEKA